MNFKLNLLTLSFVRRVIDFPLFPVLLQLATLSVMIFLVIVGWGVGNDISSEQVLVLRKTNLANLVVWGLWWPLLILGAILFGRLWCTMCPMELVNRVGDAFAGYLALPRVRLFSWLQAGWGIVGLYLLLQLLVAGYSIHRVPHYTSLMLIVMFLAAFASGLFFSMPRSFCRAFCPAQALMSVYGRWTPLQLDRADDEICKSCTQKDCVRAENRSRFDARSCPSLIRPYDRVQSDGCVLCFQCSKVCPYGNIGFGLETRESHGRKYRTLLPYEIAFVFVAAGFVMHDVCSEVTWFDSFFHWVPEQMAAMLPVLSFSWWEAIWFLVGFPSLLWGMAALISWIFIRDYGFRERLIVMVTAAAPLVALAHSAKALAKISSWGLYLPRALSEPTGISTASAILSKSLPAPGRIMSLNIIAIIMMVTLLVVSYRMWQSSALKDVPKVIVRTSLLMLVTAYLFVFAIWLNS